MNTIEFIMLITKKQNLGMATELAEIHDQTKSELIKLSIRKSILCKGSFWETIYFMIKTDSYRTCVALEDIVKKSCKDIDTALVSYLLAKDLRLSEVGALMQKIDAELETLDMNTLLTIASLLESWPEEDFFLRNKVVSALCNKINNISNDDMNLLKIHINA